MKIAADAAGLDFIVVKEAIAYAVYRGLLFVHPEDAQWIRSEMKRMGHPISHETRGRFAEVRLHERLAITHVIDFLPGVKPYESTMVVEFFPSGQTVRMVITLDPMHDEEFTKMSTMGMTSQLTKLEKRFRG